MSDDEIIYIIADRLWRDEAERFGMSTFGKVLEDLYEDGKQEYIRKATISFDAALVPILSSAENRMFSTTDRELVHDDEELPVGELRRLMWEPYDE